MRTNLTNKPVAACRIVLKMAQNHAADNMSKLTPEQCEALELVAREILRLERTVKLERKYGPLPGPF